MLINLLFFGFMAKSFRTYLNFVPNIMSDPGVERAHQF